MILLPVVAACAGLLCSDIAKLWEVAGRRYDAKPAEAQSVTQGRRIWDEMPQRPGEVRAGWGALPDCRTTPQPLSASRVSCHSSGTKSGLKLGG